MVQWLRLHAFNAGDTGLIPGQGIKVPHVVWCGQKNKIRKDSRWQEGHRSGRRLEQHQGILAPTFAVKFALWILCRWGITWLLRLISYPGKRSKVLMNQWSSVNLFILSEKARVSSYTYVHIFHFYLFILLSVLGLHCCTGFFSSCGERGSLLLSSCGRQGSHRGGFSCCGARH